MLSGASSATRWFSYSGARPTMATNKSGKAKKSAPDYTLEEARYLRHLAEAGIPVSIQLFGGEILEGTVEFFDTSFIRLTRDQAPNLFVYKHQIKYLFERE